MVMLFSNIGCSEKLVLGGYSTLCLLLLLLSPEALSDEPVTRSIPITSSPPSATICKKLLRRQECFGQTPQILEIEFGNKNESKKLVLQKLGFHEKEILVNASSKQVKVDLVKMNIFADADVHSDPKLANLQKQVNLRLSRFIYASDQLDDTGFQVIGKFKILKLNEIKILKFSTLINDINTLRELKKAGRIRNEEKRNKGIMDAFNKNRIFEYFDMIVSQLKDLPIDKAEFNVVFSKSKTVLGFKQIEQLNQRLVDVTYKETNTGQQRIETWEFYTIKKDISVLNDRSAEIEYTFLSNLDLFSNAGTTLFKALSEISIFSNDNPKYKFKKVNYSQTN